LFLSYQNQAKTTMNKLLTAASAIALTTAQIAITATASLAAIPQLNYTCPGKIEVHADQGGPVYINGKKATLKVFNENYYEAKGSGVTISISINPDGTPSVSYTGPGRNNGVCSERV
jgi:ribose 1,5-bisphosphokinase PhnN